VKNATLYCLTAFLGTLPQMFACVGCREPGVTGAEEPQTVMAGIALSWSVLMMLLFVIVVIAGLGFYIAKTCQRLDREKNRT